MKITEKKSKGKLSNNNNMNEMNAVEIGSDHNASLKKNKKRKKSISDVDGTIDTESVTKFDDFKTGKKKYENILPVVTGKGRNVENSDSHKIEECNGLTGMKNSPKKKKCKKSKQKDIVENGDSHKIEESNDQMEIKSSPKKKKNKKSKQKDLVENVHSDNVATRNDQTEMKSFLKKKKGKNLKQKGLKSKCHDETENKRKFEEIEQEEKMPDMKKKKIKKEKLSGQQLGDTDVEIKKNDKKDKTKAGHKNNENKGKNDKKENRGKKNLKRSDKKSITKDGIIIDILKCGLNIDFNICFKKDSDKMVKYRNFHVQPKYFEELKQLKKFLEAKGLSKDEVAKQTNEKFKIFHIQLKLAALSSLLNDVEKQERSALKKKLDTLKKLKDGHRKDSPCDRNNQGISIANFIYKEKDNNFWILKKSLPKVKRLSENYKNKILKRRKENSDPSLTSEEDFVYNRLMKCLLKKEYKKLQEFVKNTIMLKEKHKNLQLKRDKEETKSNGSSAPNQVTSEVLCVKSGTDKPSLKCFNCKEKGHISRDCPSEKRCNICRSIDHMRKDCPQRKCHNCSEVGHFFSDCPRATQCKYCGSENHMKRDCPESPQSASGNTKCSKCNEFGHIFKDCSKKPRRNSFPGRKCCDKCGSEDHLRRDCPNRQSGSGSKCYNCNKTGHISRDCPNKARKCCSECGSEEHLRRECPERKGDSDVKCFNCNEVGHISRECPSKTKINSYSSDKCCNECGSEDHLMRNCPQRKNKSANTKCFNCNKLGHISKDCPEGPKKRCSDCGSEEHLRRDCPEGKVNMGSDEESS